MSTREKIVIGFSIDELREQYIYHNCGHWFDKGAMRFFGTRLGAFKRLSDTAAAFITTEKNPIGERKASVRIATLTHKKRKDSWFEVKIEISTLGEFHSLTKSQANTRLKNITLKDIQE